MTYQQTRKRISRRTLPSRGNGLLGLFWASPEPPGFYTQPVSWLLLCTNQHNDLVTWGSALQAVDGGGIFAVDSGGLSAGISLALRSVGRKSRARLLMDLSSLPGGGDLFVPFSLAGQLGFYEGMELNQWCTKLIPDNSERGIEVILFCFNNKSLKSASDVGGNQYRLSQLGFPLSAMALWFGQALLFALPLIVFGIPILIAGELLLFMAALILAIIWQVFRIPGWLKGILLGTVFAVMAFWFGWIQGNNAFSIWYLAFATFFTSIWMSLVYSGAICES